jgi:NAD(P)-dependent dehydrogenase (short-subunit alcohol dehydrogenase family)
VDIRDRVILVTGAASGLGAATVTAALDAGAAGVVALDVRAPDANDPRVLAVAADVTSPEQVAGAFAAADDRFGRLDVAILCAGIAHAQRTVGRDGEPADLAAYTRVIGVNLIGMFDVVRQSASAMARNAPDDDGARGVIVMAASIAAYDGQIGQVAYAASKGGIVGMTLPLARDLAPQGIRVVTIAPGLVDTPIYDFAPPELKETLARTPVFPRRMAQPEEFARLALMVVEHGYLNGEVIRMDAALRMAPK